MPVGPRDLVTLADTKDWLNVATLNVVNDTEIQRVITDISDRFHQEAEREFKVVGANPHTRTFEVDPPTRRQPLYIDGDYVGDRNVGRRVVKIGDLTSFTAVSIIDTNWTTVLEAVALASVTGRPLVRQEWEPIRELEFLDTVTSLNAGMRVTVTGSWGFPAIPGNVRQAVLDAIVSVLDRDVEHYRQDLGGTGGSRSSESGTTVVMVGSGRQRLLSMPPSSLAVAWSYRDTTLG